MTILSAVMFTLHSARRVDLRHLKNLVGKLRIEDPTAYKKLMANSAKNPKLQQKLFLDQAAPPMK